MKKRIKRICLFLVPLSLGIYIFVSSSDSKSIAPYEVERDLTEQVLQEEIFQDKVIPDVINQLDDAPVHEGVEKGSSVDPRVLYLVKRAVYMEETKNLFYKWTDAEGQVHITDYPPSEENGIIPQYVKKDRIGSVTVYVIRDATAKKRKDSVQRSSDILSSRKIIKIARTEPLEEEEIIEEEEFEDYEEGEIISDPLEPFNRAVFEFNDRLYFLVIKPLAQGYAYLVPEDFRVVIKNFFRNITAPVRVINCLLQGKVKDAANEVLRFSINTTVGVFGLAPVAESFGIKGKEEDFGQTLAVYGVGQGPYLVLPIIGPSSLRDLVGTATDAFLDPLNHISRLETVAAIQSYKYINKTSLHLGEYEELKASALDPYTALKDAYVQYRNEEVKK